MEEFRESTSWLGDGEQLRAALGADGYLFFRQLLPADAVGEVREDITKVLFDCQWLDRQEPPARLLPGPQAVGEAQAPGYFGMYTALQATQSFHQLAVRPELLGLVETIFGEPSFRQPRDIARVGIPDGGAWRTRPHQDFPFIQGSLDVLTAWVPLAACPSEVGGLSILAGSPELGLLDVHPAPGPGGLTVDVPEDGRWYSTDYAAGDVLVFRSLTVHSSRPNASGRLRLSADLRYQAVADPVCPSALHPHFYPRIPDWPTLCRGWSDTSCLDLPDGLTTVAHVPAATASVQGLTSRFATVG